MCDGGLSVSAPSPVYKCVSYWKPTETAATSLWMWDTSMCEKKTRPFFWRRHVTWAGTVPLISADCLACLATPFRASPLPLFPQGVEFRWQMKRLKLSRLEFEADAPVKQMSQYTRVIRPLWSSKVRCPQQVASNLRTALQMKRGFPVSQLPYYFYLLGYHLVERTVSWLRTGDV